jgi:quercetin dioxygenase-like cupin family protein
MALQHADPGEIVDLRPLGEELKQAKTAAIVKSDRFEAIRLIVPAGRTIPSHQVTGTITLHCLEGRVSLGLTQSRIELRDGDWLFLKGGEPHSVEGIEDSSLLLTIIFED